MLRSLDIDTLQWLDTLDIKFTVVNICDNIFVIGTYIWTFKDIMYCYRDSKILTATVFPSTQHEFFRLPNSDSRDLRFAFARFGWLTGFSQGWIGGLGMFGAWQFWNPGMKFSDEFKRIPNRQTTQKQQITHHLSLVADVKNNIVPVINDDFIQNISGYVVLLLLFCVKYQHLGVGLCEKKQLHQPAFVLFPCK